MRLVILDKGHFIRPILTKHDMTWGNIKPEYLHRVTIADVVLIKNRKENFYKVLKNRNGPRDININLTTWNY